MNPIPSIDGFRGEYLWELEVAERQIAGMAEAIPAEKYDWRPDQKARSISEVLVHVAAGNFLLLDAVGVAASADLYGQVPADGQGRVLGRGSRVMGPRFFNEFVLIADSDAFSEPILSDAWSLFIFGPERRCSAHSLRLSGT